MAWVCKVQKGDITHKSRERKSRVKSCAANEMNGHFFFEKIYLYLKFVVRFNCPFLLSFLLFFYNLFPFFFSICKKLVQGDKRKAELK